MTALPASREAIARLVPHQGAMCLLDRVESCGAEGIANVTVASDFRTDFGEPFGVTMADGPLEHLLSRAVVVVDADGTVVYTEQVPEIGQEPDYDAALAALS